MSRMVKDKIESGFKSRYAGLESALVVNVHGLSGIEANNFREELRKIKVEVHVVQNRLARRALNGTAIEALGPSLKGPCAIVTCENPVDAAKELLRLAKDFPKLELKHGIVDGEKETQSIEDISKRKSKKELLGEVVMLFSSPGRRIAGCLNVGGRVAGCVKAIVDKLEKGEAITKVA